MKMTYLYNAHRWRMYLHELSQFIYDNFTYDDYVYTVFDFCHRMKERGYGYGVEGMLWPEEINNWRFEVMEVNSEGKPTSCRLSINFYGRHMEFDDEDSIHMHNSQHRRVVLNIFKERTRNLVGLISISDCPKQYRKQMIDIARKYIHENAMNTWNTQKELRPWIKKVEREPIK